MPRRSPPQAADRTADDARQTARQILRMESNLLGFPFFALQTKGLAKRKFIQVTGSKYLPNGGRRDFSLTISRSSTRSF